MSKKINYAKILRGGDNEPTNPALWEKAKAAAKAKFDVYPSAVANAWASRKYADEGGSWKKMADGGEVTLTPADMTLIRRGKRQLGELEPIDEPAIQQGKNIFKGASDIFKKDPYSDEARAPELFEEGYQLESQAQPTEPGGQTFVFDNNSGIDFSGIEGQAEGGMVGSLAALTTTIDKQAQSPFPQVDQIEMPMEEPSAKLKSPQALAKGGYVVTRTSERKGKTHKVTGPDGSVKYFGDPNLKNRPNNKEAKASWYARHAKSLAKNPHFRAYARSTWAEGGMVADEPEFFQEGGVAGSGGDAAAAMAERPLAEQEVKREREDAGVLLDPPPDLQPQQVVEYYDTAEKQGFTLNDEQKKQKAELQKQLASPPTPAPAPAPVAAAPTAATKPEPVKVPGITITSTPSGAQKVEVKPATPATPAAPAAKPETAPAAAPAVEDRAKLDELLGKLKTLQKETTSQGYDKTLPTYEKLAAEIEDQGKGLSASQRGELFTELGKVQIERKALQKKLLEDFAAGQAASKLPPADEKRGPLGFLREGARLANKYGEQKDAQGNVTRPDRYGDFQAIRKRVIGELGGNEKDPRVSSEATRIAEQILDRRIAQQGITQIGEAAETARQKELKAAADKELKAAADKAAADQAAADQAGPPVRAATPVRPRPEAIAQEKAAAAAAAAAGAPGEAPVPAPGTQPVFPAAPAGGATAVSAEGLPTRPTLAEQQTATTFPVLTDSNGVTYTLQDLANPDVRYSPDVMKELESVGDYKLVFDAAMTVLPAGPNKEADAKKIAVDEVLRTKGLVGVGGLGPVPAGMEAMEAARQSPEYKAIMDVARANADIRAKDIELQIKQADVERQIKNAQADLQLRQLEDYEIRKFALDSQTNALRASILTDKINPDRLFAGRGIQRGIATVLGLIGKGLGAQGSVQDFIQSRIKDDIQLQLNEMDKKRTLLGTLIQQGNTLDEATRLADAFYKQVFAAQIEKATGTIRDERARLAALETANKLRAEAATKAEEIVKKQVDAIYEPYKLKLQNAAGGVKNAAEYLRIMAPPAAAKLRAATRKGPAAPPDASNELKAFFEGKSLDQGQFARVNLEATQKKLDPRLGEKVVKVLREESGTFTKQDGTKVPYKRLVVDPQRVLLAYDRTAKDNAAKQTSSALAFMSKLDKLEEKLAKYNYSGVQALASPADKGSIEVLVGELASDLGVLRNIGVPQEAEYQRIVGSLPTLELLQREAYPQSKFAEFRNLMNEAILRARNQNLIGGGLAGAGAASAMPPPTRPTARPKGP